MSDSETREDDTEGDIVEALAAGDYRGVIDRCARVHGATVGRLCMAFVGSQAEAQELAQETFVAALKSIRSFRSEGSLRGFLFAIARRLCARHVETCARRERRLRLVHDTEVNTGDDAFETLAKRQRAEAARAALQQLRPSERDAVVLRFQGDLSFREVAEACGIDEPTARKRVNRAIARLRTTIGNAP